MKWNVLNQPYPFDVSVKKTFVYSISFGLFIFLFLAVFQPFGLSNYHSETKIWELSGYGWVTALLLFFNTVLFSFLLPNWYTEKNWTVGKNIFFTVWVIFTIGLGNLLYSAYRNYVQLDLDSFLFYQGVTVLVGALPVTISTFIVYNRKLNRSLKEASELNNNLSNPNNSPIETIEIPSKNKTENLTINLHHLLAIKAVENYVEILYLDENLKTVLLRNTMKNIELTLKRYAFIQKCHRSYLVNTEMIESFYGNAQGLKLSFKTSEDISIPVSRSYVEAIKNTLKSA